MSTSLPIDLSRAQWRKASRTSSSGNDCVEVANLPRLVAVRDSKNPGGPVLAFGRKEWSDLARRIAAGELDA